MNTLADLSAVWPTLRHGQYTWAVVEDNPDDNFDFQNGLKYPCDYPLTLKCGNTGKVIRAVFILSRGQWAMTRRYIFWTLPPLQFSSFVPFWFLTQCTFKNKNKYKTTKQANELFY